jgi:uncharacterized protein involved in exopolysaccharide biosynthesis
MSTGSDVHFQEPESVAGVQRVRTDPGYNPPAREMPEALAVLVRARRLLILFVVSAMLSALALTYIYSERYCATTTILYRPNSDIRFEGLGPQQRTLGFPIPLTVPFEALGLTIKQVGTSERILRPVVVDLGLDQPDTTHREGLAKYYHETREAVKKLSKNAWEILKYGRTIEANPTTTAILELAANTTIDTKQKNYAAVLTVADKDPARAAKIVDRIGAELVKFVQEQSVGAAREQGAKLDTQLTRTKEEIERTRQAIQSLKTAQGFIALDEETALHLRTAEQFEQKLLATNAELTAALAKLKALSSQREGLAPLIKASETYADDPVYTHLRQLKSSSEVELQGLIARSPKDHPEVRSTQAKIQAADELLAGAKATRLTQESTEVSKVYQTLHAEELKAKADVAALKEAQAALSQGLQKARDRITKPSVEAEYNDLQLRLTVLESDYKKLATVREEVRASELTSRPEVRTLHPATPPDQPFRPIKVFHVLLSGFLALILGIGFAYLFDYLRLLLGAQAPRQALKST